MKKTKCFQTGKNNPVKFCSQTRPVIIGRFGPPILACIRSWGKQGYPVGLICVVSGQEKKPTSKYLSDAILIKQDSMFSNKGLQIITNFLKKFKATGIIAIDEKISIRLNEIAGELPADVTIWSASNEIIRKVLSKKKQIEIAKNAGFQMLPTCLIDKDFENTKELHSIPFPLCLRPSQPGSVQPSFKVEIATSLSRLRKIINDFETINEPVIAQPFMNLPNLVIHGTRTMKGKTEGVEAFIVERKFEGVTLVLKPVTVDSDLLKKCQSFTELFNITGNYHFEFLYDSKTQQAFFLEINLRLGGTTAKVFSCGYDEPMFALNAYGPLVNLKDYKIQNHKVSSKQALLKYLFYAVSGRLTPLDYPNGEFFVLRLAKIFWAFFFYKDEVLNFDDIKGSISLYRQNFLSAFLH
ncbi:ATP-grasp domain-containing protein [Desulfobacula phenolica]|uniref:ATP-grasp domain-containing protein n=1 Tax=Desulfobacula phenolica TaxID=90732 RepID=A0A1H2EPG8_9BACT|nr:hypothetical protein [Desulfobacula phenolica]SDT97017.1 hypothetical protein SAMN04487931_103271 [Desulfobacula phenolica]